MEVADLGRQVERPVVDDVEHGPADRVHIGAEAVDGTGPDVVLDVLPVEAEAADDPVPALPFVLVVAG
jgi:hypothetical protein